MIGVLIITVSREIDGLGARKREINNSFYFWAHLLMASGKLAASYIPELPNSVQWAWQASNANLLKHRLGRLAAVSEAMKITP